MSFKDQGWSARYKDMGDLAEARCKQWAEHCNRGIVDWGLKRPEGINQARLPAFVRFAPDFLMTNRFIEAQGFGRDQKFKLKDVKYQVLVEYDKHHPVDLFAWDSHHSRYFVVNLASITAGIVNGDFPEGVFDPNENPKLYYEIPASWLVQYALNQGTLADAA